MHTAMLVAPLMTPLVAIGFALVQGNEKLIRSALRSVALGFALAFAIGVGIGLLVPDAFYADLKIYPNVFGETNHDLERRSRAELSSRETQP